jgi:hypothetical protein
MTSSLTHLSISGDIVSAAPVIRSELIKLAHLPTTSIQGTCDTTPQEEMKSGDLGGQVIRIPFLSFVQETSQQSISGTM